MQQRKSKKILIYFFLLLVVGSINNLNFNSLTLRNINNININININGLDIKDKLILLKQIENFSLNNIFLISKIDLTNEIKSNPLVENYTVFKRYPSSIDINIEKTKFLAKINKNGQIFYIGSNGKFIKNDFLDNQLPYIFGNPEVIDFFYIKEIIDKSKISYSKIKNLFFFPSKRWDLELRDNTIIKLPNENTNLALKLAIDFLDDNKFIDARIKNQIILND
ncbi:cell division protein FtsQ/DivIB [Candidatus Pelagibacter bacterium nBUS_49]|uniref:cell division protein FtsQ/DivIB n=1 Tax=Candidatus Pelagibacter bacterium nBUS_49 TaxID=3374196 RepID=UPI003EB74CD9